MSVAGSLNVVHPFLIFQVCVFPGEPFLIEISLRDKNNSRKRLMFSEGARDIVAN